MTGMHLVSYNEQYSLLAYSLFMLLSANVCTFVCVSVPKAMNNYVVWCDIDPI